MKNTCISYAGKALGAQILCVTLLAPYILIMGERSDFFPQVSGQWRHPWDFSHILLFLGLAVLGFACARALKSPKEFFFRHLPVLVFPDFLTVLWTCTLIQAEGDYFLESSGFLDWSIAHWLTLPPHQLVLSVAVSPGAGTHPVLENLAVFFRLLTPEDIEFTDFIAFGSEDYFSTWQCMGLPLFMHAAWLFGFETGIWKRDPVVPFHLRPAHIAVPLLCAVPIAVLLWYSSMISDSLVGPRPAWDPALEAKILSSAETLNRSVEERLTLDTPPSLRIRADYPKMDGATAFSPVYAAAFHAIYEKPAPPAGADQQTLLRLDRDFDNLLSCSKTRYAYAALTAKQADVIFAFAPSDEQVRDAQTHDVTFRLIPLGLDAFVFLLHTDNPVGSLTRKQIQDIYTRSATNWRQVGGRDANILPFQRPKNSGSQTIMEKLVMKGLPMTQPLREEYIPEMGGVIVQIAEYRNEAASIGYSFRRYAVSRKMEDLKFAAVDGVPPTVENIASGAYPFVAPFYAVVRNEPPSPELQALLDWFTGPEGRALIAKAGYVPMK